MSLVTASERDLAQTEALTGNVVSGLTFNDRLAERSLLERSVKQGDNPVVRSAGRESVPEYRGLEIPREHGRHRLLRLNTTRDR